MQVLQGEHASLWACVEFEQWKHERMFRTLHGAELQLRTVREYDCQQPGGSLPGHICAMAASGCCTAVVLWSIDLPDRLSDGNIAGTRSTPTCR